MRLLKTAVMDFYTVYVLAEAKVRLQKDILAMNLSTKLPHIPKRRGGDGQLEHEVDDLLSMFTFLDENKASDRVPKYVAESPDNMPSLRIYEGDIAAVSYTHLTLPTKRIV